VAVFAVESGFGVCYDEGVARGLGWEGIAVRIGAAVGRPRHSAVLHIAVGLTVEESGLAGPVRPARVAGCEYGKVIGRLA
jgi:hypothetical protein